MTEFDAAWDILKRYSDDMMGRLHRELLRQNQFRQGSVDTSQMSRDDRIRLHNAGVLTTSPVVKPNGKLLDSGYKPIPPRSYVPVVTSKKAVKAIHAPALASPMVRITCMNPMVAVEVVIRSMLAGDFRVEDREQYGSYRDEQEAMNLPKFPFDLGPRDAVRDSATDPLGIDKALVKAFSKAKNLSPFMATTQTATARKAD